MPIEVTPSKHLYLARSRQTEVKTPAQRSSQLKSEAAALKKNPTEAGLRRFLVKTRPAESSGMLDRQQLRAQYQEANKALAGTGHESVLWSNFNNMVYGASATTGQANGRKVSGKDYDKALEQKSTPQSQPPRSKQPEARNSDSMATLTKTEAAAKYPPYITEEATFAVYKAFLEKANQIHEQGSEAFTIRPALSKDNQETLSSLQSRERAYAEGFVDGIDNKGELSKDQRRQIFRSLQVYRPPEDSMHSTIILDYLTGFSKAIFPDSDF